MLGAVRVVSPHARAWAKVRAGGGCSSNLATLGWQLFKVDASPEAREAMRLRSEYRRARNQRLRYVDAHRPGGRCEACGYFGERRVRCQRCKKDFGLAKGSTCTAGKSWLHNLYHGGGATQTIDFDLLGTTLHKAYRHPDHIAVQASDVNCGGRRQHWHGA